MTYTATLRLGEDGCTVSVMNLTDGSADFGKLWHWDMQEWTDVDSTMTRLALTQTSFDVYQADIDLSVFEVGSVLRFWYRAGDLTPLDDEVIYVDANHNAIPEADGVLAEMVEISEDGDYRLKASALELYLAPVKYLAVDEPLQSGSSYSIVYRYEKEITPPDPSLNIVSIQIHRASSPDAEAWPVIETQPYTQGQTTVVFYSEFSGYFRLSFLDADGQTSGMGDVFGVEEDLMDLNFVFNLHSDSQLYYIGEKKFLIIQVEELENKISVLPTTYVSIEDPNGTVLVDKALATIDGMEALYLWDTTGLEAGKYKVYCFVQTATEYIRSPSFSVTLKTG